MTVRQARSPRAAWPTLAAAALALVVLAPIATLWLPEGRSQMHGPAVAVAPGAGPVVAAGEGAYVAWSSFAASLLVAAGAAVLAVAVGGLVSALLTLTDLAGRSLWSTAMLLAFAAPGTVWALGQVYCYGAGGLLERCFGDGLRPWLASLDTGHYLSTTLVLAEIHAPLAMLVVGRGLARLAQTGFEPARLALPSARLGLWVAGAIRQELAAAWLLCLALGLGNFAVPHVMQCRLFPIEIYLRMTNYLDLTGASRSAAVLLSATVLATVLLTLAEHGKSYSSAGAPAAEPIELGRRAWLVRGGLAAYLAVTVFLPLGAIAYECRSASNFIAALRDAAPETENTLRIALAAAGLALAAGVVMGMLVARLDRAWVESLAIVPLGLPALVLGLAFSRFYNRAWPVDLGFIGDGSLLVVLGLTARSWPFVTRIIADGRRRIPPEWREAGELAGLSLARRGRWISGPLLADHAVAGALVTYVIVMGDVEISQVLCAPGLGTLSLRLFTFLHFGPVHVAANLAALELALTVLPVLAYFLFTQRCLKLV